MPRIKIDIAKLKWHFINDTGIPGTFQFVAIHEDFSCPVGMVYFKFTYDRNIEILDSYVNEYLRRQGIRTEINKKLFEYYPAIKSIVTQDGTSLGKRFLKGSGYKKKSTHYFVNRKELRN